MLRKWLAPGLIIVLTTLFLLLWESSPEFLLPDGLFGDARQAEPEERYPTNILINTSSKRFAADGQLISIISATRTRFFQADPDQPAATDHTEIDNPNITLMSEDQKPWQAVAELGRTSDQGRNVELSGNVRLWLIDDKGKKSELSTSYLIVKPEQQYAETDKAVTIHSVGEITRATGMRAYLEQDRIQLLSKVRGIYEPNK